MVLSAQEIQSTKTDPKNVIRFEDGIYGFENVKDYVLLQEEKTATIWSLQAAYCDYPVLYVINPFLIAKNYNPDISKEDFEKLGRPEEKDLCILAVAVIKKDLEKSVINLKSPIVINADQKIGRQIISEDSQYPVRYPLFSTLSASSHGQ